MCHKYTILFLGGTAPAQNGKNHEDQGRIFRYLPRISKYIGWDVILSLKLRRKLLEYHVDPFAGIIGTDPGIATARNIAKRVAQGDSSVILHGETGTGKEIFAEAIHRASKRAKGPFVAVNCAAIPESLMESELFGYEAGAFTGALTTGKLGKFEAATSGTIFLDEIGDMSPMLQAKLLRTIQERTVE
ncbi:MAG: sigma-54 factor interaction domain-containing protein, partial [Firmicutes bacterium]|nr:sigma-54 factor interaction domain-containing protein [Bacillota bacterium]